MLVGIDASRHGLPRVPAFTPHSLRAIASLLEFDTVNAKSAKAKDDREGFGRSGGPAIVLI
jgi:hypothetical protein